ncbi:putative CmcJ-like methyltransferase [Hyaloscypha variabilis]
METAKYSLSGRSSHIQNEADSSLALRTSVNYAQQKPEYDSEKPYVMRYRDPSFPSTNVDLDIISTTIQDMRNVKSMSLDVDGFELVECKTKMLHDEYYDDEKVTSIYLAELRDFLRTRYKASRVEFIRHNIRKRHPIFPLSTGSPYTHDQPAQMVHVDITTERSITIVQNMFGSELKEIPIFNIINIWKPLRGPLYDWPLAMCDPATVDYDHDIMSADLLWPDEVVENCMVFHNPCHKWYYFSGQTPSELLIFRQMDSTMVENNGVPHTAFQNPLTPDGDSPRESMEVQAVLFFDPEIVTLKRTLKYPVYNH